jgi:hypothetical protein
MSDNPHIQYANLQLRHKKQKSQGFHHDVKHAEREMIRISNLHKIKTGKHINDHAEKLVAHHEKAKEIKRQYVQHSTDLIHAKKAGDKERMERAAKGKAQAEKDHLAHTGEPAEEKFVEYKRPMKEGKEMKTFKELYEACCAACEKRADIEEVKEPTGGLKDACWKGYTAVGMKMKNGRKVPNCVPANEEVEEIDERNTYALYDDHPKFKDAHSEIHSAVTNAHKDPKAVVKAMRKHKQVGATDSASRDTIYAKVKRLHGAKVANSTNVLDEEVEQTDEQAPVAPTKAVKKYKFVWNKTGAKKIRVPVKEDAEQIDESEDAVARLADKLETHYYNGHQMGGSQADKESAIQKVKHHISKAPTKHLKALHKTNMGWENHRAGRQQGLTHPVTKHIASELKNRGVVQEEVEQIDELSKTTVKSYADKARMDQNDTLGIALRKYSSPEEKAKYKAIADKRGRGMSLAYAKLSPNGTRLYSDRTVAKQAKVVAKEEVEQTDEQAPVAPTLDRKYLKGTPEHKAYKASKVRQKYRLAYKNGKISVKEETDRNQRLRDALEKVKKDFTKSSADKKTTIKMPTPAPKPEPTSVGGGTDYYPKAPYGRRYMGDSVEMNGKKIEETQKGKNVVPPPAGTIATTGGIQEEENENKPLGKVMRAGDGKKKFKVFVKNANGNVVKVGFGDPNMEIKRDDPERRKNFRARHNCDTATDRTTPRYWSCRQWRSSAKVEA